jgi:hypothetical protein
MTHIQEIEKLVSESPNEIYPGQNQEIIDLVARPSDICEHIPTLIRYALQCSHITEFGVRFGVSTRALLFARPKVLRTFDLYHWTQTDETGKDYEPDDSKYRKYKSLYSSTTDFVHKAQTDTNTMDVIDPTDLLFIDTFHHRDCLITELERHGNQAKKFIILHDTETNGEHGSCDGITFYRGKRTTNEAGTGLWYALFPWLEENKHWSIVEHRENNHGLTVLGRKND